ncbi:MAG: glycosyltransferase family 2 protein [Planctomycetes bacterium]|nr:glycosyltransferase family 2 protein [Planctomycetota bacterium]
MKNDRDDIRISAVMPAYNCEKYISRALDSILKQSRPADEIIVIDDGSTDRTGEIVQGYGDKVKYILQENTGAGAARNRGIEEASCEWIAFLDSDDEWLDDNLKLLTGVVGGNKNLVWAFGNFLNCDCDTQTRKEAHDIQKAEIMLDEREYFNNFLDCFMEGFHAWTGSIIIRRDVFNDVGLFMLDQHRAEDTDMWLRIAYKYQQVGYAKEPMAIYHREVAGSLTKSYRNFHIISDMIDKHLKLSAESGHGEEFVLCGGHMLSVWIRDMLSAGHTEGLLETVKRYEDILGWRFKKEMWLRVKHPRIAPFCLGVTSCIKKCVRSVTKILRFNKG